MGTKTIDAPDGGWGWVIVACSFIIHMFTVGTMFALSILYVSWLDEFQTSKSVTSWIISVGVAVLFGIAPIPASLASRIGHKAVVIIGGIMAFAGFAISFFAPNVPVLVLSIGILAGTGCGFCYLPAIAMTAMYFTKRRSVAMGIGTAGVGIGAFILAPLFHWCIEEYGWRGTLLITAAISLNLCVCGFLMRPLPVSENVVSADDDADTNEDTRPMLQDVIAFEIDVDVEEEKGHENGKTDIPVGDHETASRIANSALQFHHQNGQQQNQSGQEINVDLSSRSRQTNSRGSLQLLKSPVVDSGGRQFSSARDLRPRKLSIDHSVKSFRTGSHVSGHLSALDILMSGSMYSLSMLNGEKNSLGSIVFSPPFKMADTQDGLKKKEDEHCCLLCRVCGSFLSSFALLKNTTFLSFVLSNILTNLTYLMPVLYMVDRALDNGIDKTSAAVLVSLNGAGNVFGRIFFGFLADRSCVDRFVCYITCLSICGIATCLSPTCGSSVVLHAVYALTFGCFMGAYVSLAPVVTVDLMGVSIIGEAYGLVLLFMGLAGMAGPPLAGGVFDFTGSYTTSFILHGLFVLISGLMLVPIVIKKKCRRVGG